MYMTVIDSLDISFEEEGDPDFTNINAGTIMEDDTAPPIQPTYNESKTSTKDQDIWDWVQNELWDMRAEQTRQRHNFG